MKKHIIKHFCIFLICTMAISICACGKDKSIIPQNTTSEPTTSAPKYNLQLDVDCAQNLIFSTYDVKVIIGFNTVATLKHGAEETYNKDVTAGNHSIRFEKSDDSSVKGETTVDISGDTKIKIEISCYNDHIDVKPVANASVSDDASNYKEKKLDDVKKAFMDAGFKNIQTEELKDITAETSDKLSTVDSVTIDNLFDYKKDDTFVSDAHVVIKYHSPKEINSPIGVGEFSKYTVESAEQKFKDAGFTNIEIAEQKSYFSFGKNNGDLDNIQIDGQNPYTDKTYKYNAKVKIYYLSLNEGSTKSDTKLDLSYAKDAFEDYGESIYKYGFKCHWITDGISKEKQSDGSYFLKVGVTIKNEYGASYDTIAEAKVTGSNANPQVIDFYVSD